MKKLLCGALALACLAVAGCQTTGVTTANNALASLAKNDLPAACAIVSVAEGYFATLKPQISAKNQKIEAQAAAVAATICNNPPADLATAFVDLFAAWTAVQNATVTN